MREGAGLSEGGEGSNVEGGVAYDLSPAPSHAHPCHSAQQGEG